MEPSFTEDDYDPKYVGYFFILFSGLAASIIALLVWTKWDTNKRKKCEKRDSVDSDPNIEGNNGKPKDFIRKDIQKLKKWNFDKTRTPQFEHPWLYTTLKGHVNHVMDMDFSSNGRYLVSVSGDRSLYLWHVKDFGNREHKVDRCSVEVDSASHVAFASDSKNVIMSLKIANKLDVYKKSRKEGTQNYKFSRVESVNFPVVHENDIISVGISCNGKFAMSASFDSQLVIYTIYGNILKKVQPKLNILYEASISPCGRFVAASGFTPDVFVFEVLLDRHGNFQDLKKVFDLKGHSSGIYSFSFNQSSTRCVTASKDGTWNLYDTDVRYNLGEDTKIIASGEFEVLKRAQPDSVKVVMSPSGNSFAISTNRHICFFSAVKPEKQFKMILDVHDRPITSLRMSPCGKYVASSGDRYIRVFRNVAEFYSNVISLEKDLKATRVEGRKRRLEEQLQEAKRVLSSFPEL
ncbi:unnamed protein product [Thelazia callipaeda]|uniref:WD_REPEATS_REGION domain-containing protein n=1 Tax=Thelazia callipaeda TaxID=103827 RepID=A0A0N5D3A2_THECL|nr:unnamed protein product [Thelazia callipaeda]